VINQTNILSILPTPTIGGAPLSGDILSLGDSTFQNFMKDAVRESAYAREETPPVSKERVDSPSTPEQNKVETHENHPAEEIHPAESEALPSQSTKETPESNYHEPTTTHDNDPTGQNVAVAENQTAIVEQLKDLNLSPEKIDALLESLNVENGADVNSLLQSLVQQLNLNPENFDLGATADPSAQRQQLLSLLKGQEGQAVDLLAKAGLTQQESNNLLSKLQSEQVNQATLKAGKETADDLLVKLSGEKSAEGKTDFLSQFSDLNKQGDKPQRQAAIEKVLKQADQEPVSDLNLKPLEKSLATAPKLEEPIQPNPSQGAAAAPNHLANATAPKGSEGVKAPSEVKVQNVIAASDSAAKPAEGAKAVTAETLSAKGTTEAKVLNQIMNKFSLRTNGSQSEIKIKLDPPSLGTVRMNISTSGDSVRTVVIAENHAVKQIIENNLIQLRDSMSGQGLKVESFTVLVGGNEGQGGQQNTPNEGFSHYAGSPDAEQLAATETLPDNAEVGASRILYGDSQSISVVA
jgi:flagellar hook-length control protein FliK